MLPVTLAADQVVLERERHDRAVLGQQTAGATVYVGLAVGLLVGGEEVDLVL